MRNLLALQDLQVSLALGVGVRVAEGEVVNVVLAVEPEGQGQDRVVPVVRRPMVIDVLVWHSSPVTERTMIREEKSIRVLGLRKESSLLIEKYVIQDVRKVISNRCSVMLQHFLSVNCSLLQKEKDIF